MFWPAEDLKDTGWNEGWYLAMVSDVVDEVKGIANITYVVEPSECYEVPVEEL